MRDKTIVFQLHEVTDNILKSYKDLIEFAEELGKEGDYLKDIAGDIVEQLEKISEIYY